MAIIYERNTMKILTLTLLIFISGCSGIELNSGSADKTKNYNFNKKRTPQEISDTFGRERPEIYELYNQARENNPNLKGGLSVKIGIDNDGVASNCMIQNSTLGNVKLEDEIVLKICSINFGKKRSDLDDTQGIVFSIQFLPD